MNLSQQLNSTIRNVPDFPSKGIMFKDITPVLESPALCREIIQTFKKMYSGKNIDAIAGVESRGFFFGLSLAMELNVPFITVRKKGKLPYKTVSYKYDLEYGSAEIEMHLDSVKPGWNVLIHDDLLATGGTAAATASLLIQEKAKVAGFAFLVDLAFLNGRKKLEAFSSEIVSLVTY